MEVDPFRIEVCHRTVTFASPVSTTFPTPRYGERTNWESSGSSSGACSASPLRIFSCRIQATPPTSDSSIVVGRLASGGSVGAQQLDAVADAGVVEAGRARESRRSPRACTSSPPPDARRRSRACLQAGDDRRLGRLARLLAGRFDRLPHFRQRRGDRGEEEILLTVEVVVERLAGNRGTADDVGDLRRLVALLRGQFGDRVHHPPPLVAGDELARQLRPRGAHRDPPLGSRRRHIERRPRCPMDTRPTNVLVP